MYPGRIAAALNEQGILTVRGNKWHDSSVNFILGNEKYVGDLELQKTITVDFLNHKSVKNAGLAPKYYVENHHVAIIDRLTWDKVQAIREGKRKTQKARAEKSGSEVSVHSLSNLTCGDCGSEFRRYTYSGQAHNYEDERGCTKEEKRFYADVYRYTYYVWRCYDKFGGRTKDGAFNKQEKALFDSRCSSKVLNEIAICQSFMEMLYGMKREYEELGEQSSFSEDFRIAYEKVYQSCKGSDYTTQQMELLDRQIAELEEQYQVQVSKQIEALRNAVEDAGEESPDLGAAKIYADLAEEIKQKIDRLTEERSQLEDERGITVRMKKNYDLFIGCLLALPEENAAGWKLNVNGRDVDGSLFTEADGTPRERKLGLYNQGRLKMDAEKMMQAPDFLKFDKGMYSAFFPKAVVKGDVIEFTTNFGVKLVCRGVDRSLRRFYGFRRIREDGSVEIMTEHWQVADSSINYKRKKRKIVKNADDTIDKADETEADAVEAV